MSIHQLSQVLPLPEEDLRQVLDYASTLSKAEAASHFGNLLGDSPLAVDFIASFNSSRREPASVSQPQVHHGAATGGGSAPSSDRETLEAVPKGKKHQKKKKANIHELEARKVDAYSTPGTAYNKKTSDLEYIPQRASAPTSAHASRSNTPKPTVAPSQPPQPPKQSSSAGYLISDVPSKSKAKSQPGTRSSTPKPPTKVSLTGGTPMAGQSTALSDLDAAIRALEITTNPTLNADSTSKGSINARKCNCVATRHPLLNAAPNCLSCGKVICLKQGLGPCTFCGTPLLKSEDVQTMIRELKDERGREKMKANKESHKRAEVSKKPLPFHPIRDGTPAATASGMDSVLSAEEKARAHRDKLLNFQSQNAQRTTVHDEAADFDFAPSGSSSMWASPEERARELKKQQKMMREMEWQAKPEWEKRKQVLSIDLVGGKVVRKMVERERPESPVEEDEPATPPEPAYDANPSVQGQGGGAFSKNPLLAGLIKPVFEIDEKEKGVEVQSRRERQKWRRVQNDLDDNEGVILDGGIRGHQEVTTLGDEPECG